MKIFEISRINTDYGTFRVVGQWCDKKCEISDLSISLLEIMSTDGWSELELSSNNSQALIGKIKPYLLEYLISTNKF